MSPAKTLEEQKMVANPLDFQALMMNDCETLVRGDEFLSQQLSNLRQEADLLSEPLDTHNHHFYVEISRRSKEILAQIEDYAAKNNVKFLGDGFDQLSKTFREQNDPMVLGCSYTGYIALKISCDAIFKAIATLFKN